MARCSKVPALVAAMAALGLSIAPREAGADQRRVAVLAFEGPKRVRARNQVLRHLRRAVELVPADAERIDAVLSGEVRRARRGFKLDLTLRAGTDRTEVSSITVRLRESGRLRIPARRALRRELLPVIQELPEGGAPEPEPGAVVEESAPPPPRAPPEPPERVRSLAEPAPERPRRPGGSRPGPRPAARARPAAGPDPSVARLSSGVSLDRRDLRFDVDQDYPGRPRPYRGLFAAGHVMGELYPLSASSVQLLRDLGLELEIGGAPPFASQAAGLSGPLVTRYYYWGAGVRYRVRFGGSEIHLGAGYGEQTFELESPSPGGGSEAAELPGLPADVTYRSVRAGGGVSLRAGPLAPFLEGRYLLVQESGEIEARAVYGSASADGFAAAVGLKARPSRRLVLQASAHYTRLELSFLGIGAESDVDGDGVADVKGAVDQYLGLRIGVGIEL